jgi:hypothetical protein
LLLHEVKLGTLYLKLAQQACPIRNALEEMGQPQPATLIQTDNCIAAGIANNTVKMKHRKSGVMLFSATLNIVFLEEKCNSNACIVLIEDTCLHANYAPNNGCDLFRSAVSRE